MGNGDKHMSVTLLQNGVRIRAVAFGGAEWIPHLPPPGEPFHIAFKPKINEFRGRRTAELELLDWRPDGIDVSVDLPPMADATA
jgi:single-stranded-DNA-specific exonuclease